MFCSYDCKNLGEGHCLFKWDMPPAPSSNGPSAKVEGRDGNRPAFPFVNGTIMRINVARRGPQSLSFALLNIKETKP